MKISATAPKANNRSVTIDYEKLFEKTDDLSAADALAKNVETFGPEAVNAAFLDAAVIRLQARIRSWLQQGIVANKKGETGERLTDEQIQTKANDWILGVVTVKKADPVAAFLAKAATMSPDKLMEVIQQLKAKAMASAEGEDDENGDE